MNPTNQPPEPNSPGLVLGIHPSPAATGLALHNPRSRPQLVWAALLAPTADETLGDYADRITALATAARGMRDTPIPVHLSGRRAGSIGGRPPVQVETRALIAAIVRGLDPPVVEVPYGDYHSLLPAQLRSPICDGNWPDGFGPRQDSNLQPVAVAALLTRWTPYPAPPPLRHLDEVSRLGDVAPLRGHEERSDPKGAAPPPGLAAPPPDTAAASAADGRR